MPNARIATAPVTRAAATTTQAPEEDFRVTPMVVGPPPLPMDPPSEVGLYHVPPKTEPKHKVEIIKRRSARNVTQRMQQLNEDIDAARWNVEQQKRQTPSPLQALMHPALKAQWERQTRQASSQLEKLERERTQLLMWQNALERVTEELTALATLEARFEEVRQNVLDTIPIAQEAANHPGAAWKVPAWAAASAGRWESDPRRAITDMKQILQVLDSLAEGTFNFKDGHFLPSAFAGIATAGIKWEDVSGIADKREELSAEYEALKRHVARDLAGPGLEREYVLLAGSLTRWEPPGDKANGKFVRYRASQDPSVPTIVPLNNFEVVNLGGDRVVAVDKYNPTDYMIADPTSDDGSDGWTGAE